MTAILPVANLVNLIIDNWIVAIAVFAIFASICLGLFKGAKHGIRALIVLLAVAVTAFAGIALFYFIRKDLDGLIKFGIAWFPTIFFMLIVVLSTLIGIQRGLRKSLILTLHAVISAAICLGLFFFCVTSSTVDKLILDGANLIIGLLGKGSLQSVVGVSSECKTLREVLMELFNSYAVQWGDFGILLGGSSAYVLTLVNMVYRLVFSVIFFFVYEIMLFVLYLLYLAFYSEKKYKRNKNIRFAMNTSDRSYNKHPVGGGCVGLVRGLVTGAISLSFIGSALFIAVGGTGASRLPEDISFGENYTQYISVYRSIESYGDQGIFKILNAIDDPEQTPYYLFAADLIFSGGLDDEEHGVSGTVRFRKELAAYTGFAKNTFALLMKHDTDGDIAAILRGQGEGDAMDKILKVCTKTEFRVEFDDLIDNFDAQTYIINFAFSLADAVIANVDEVSFMQSLSAENKDLLQVLFKKNYLSDTIPDERDRKNSESQEITGEIPPHLTINHLFTKRDAQIVLDIVLSILSNEIKVSDPHTIATVLIPDIEELSILSSKRSSEMDPVLGRLYCYLDNKYLTDADEDGITYAEIKDEPVKWTKEIRALLSVADGLVTMYDKIQGSEGANIFTTVTSLFDETNEDYEANVAMYEELTEVVSDSVILSKVLCSDKVYNLLSTQLKSISENIYLPRKLPYENRYDEEGNLISHGEAYHILRGLRLLVEKENKELINSLLDSSAEFENILEMLSETITRDDPNAPGNTLASYLTESTFLRSILSSVIIDRAGDMLVVPYLSLDTENGQAVNIINKAELRQIFDALPELFDLILPLTSGELNAESVNNILENEAFNSLLDNGNKILEATIAKVLIDALYDDEAIIISKRLENCEEWITVNTPGELRKFLRVREILSLDIEALLKGEGLEGSALVDKIRALENEEIKMLLDSEVFYYSASKMLDSGDLVFEDFRIIVPLSSFNVIEDEKIDNKVIKKDELSSVFLDLKDFGLVSGMSNENVLRKLVEKVEILNGSKIISASVVNFIVSKNDICTALNMPDAYLIAGSGDKLKEYGSTNIWYTELPNLISAIDEIFGISAMDEDEKFVFTGEEAEKKTKNLILTLNEMSFSKPSSSQTRLDVCYSSVIIQNNITAELDKALNGADGNDESLIDVAVRDSLKTDLQAGKPVYPKSEISSLIVALETLEIEDIDSVSSDKFSSLELYRENIGVLCASGIVRGIITKKIDLSLTENEGGIIESSVKSKIKGRELCYSEAEITSLINALDALGLNDFNDFESYDFSANISGLLEPFGDTEERKLDIIYRSDIVVGILTKAVKDTFRENSLAYHNLANRSDLAVLKKQEIESLLSFLGNNELKNFDVGAISLSDILYQVSAGDDGNPRSYLISANFTKTVIDNYSIVVPASVYENRLIKVEEATDFINAIIVLQNGSDKRFEDWDVENDLVLPEVSDRAEILKSVIMRATFSNTIFTNEQNKNIVFKQSNIELDKRIDENGDKGKAIAYINTYQLEVLFNVLDACSEDKTLSIPSFTDVLSILVYMEHFDLLYEFDVTRHRMSKIVMADPSLHVNTALDCAQEECYLFTTDGSDIVYTPQTIDVLNKDKIQGYIGPFNVL